MKSKLSILLLGMAGWFASQPATACTGITVIEKTELQSLHVPSNGAEAT